MYFKTFNIPAAATVPVLCILLFTVCRQFSVSAPRETATLKPSVHGRDGIIADYRYLSDPSHTLSLVPSKLETARTNWCLKSGNVWVPVMGSISSSGKKQGCGLAGNAGIQYLKGNSTVEFLCYWLTVMGVLKYTSNCKLGGKHGAN